MASVLLEQLDCEVPELPARFELDGDCFECTERLRRLPGKRLVCAGQWRGQPVIAKFYIDPRRATVHAHREAVGARAMLARGILSPPLLDMSLFESAHVLLFERITEVQTIKQAWDKKGDETRAYEILHSLVQTLAAHHKAGLIQQDLHFGNFLIRDEAIYSLDGGSISVHSEPIGRRAAIINLGLLFAQCFPQYDQLAHKLYAEYARARGWVFGDADLRALGRAIHQQRQRRKRIVLRKVFRECSAFTVRHQHTQFSVCDRAHDSPAMRSALENLDQVIATGRPLKQGRTSTVSIAEIDGREVVIKRYNIKNPLHACIRALRRSRASISWENAQRLAFYGIATPKPIAMVEQRYGWFRRKAYFVAAYVGGEPSDAYFERPGITQSESGRAMIARIAKLMHELRHLRIGHGDMKASNLLLEQQTPYLIDLDAMREHRLGWLAARASARDRRRFLRNWASTPALQRLFRDRLKDKGHKI